MTKREYFEAVINAHISPEMDEVSAGYIAKMDAANEARKGKVAKKSVEFRAYAETEILPLLGGEAQTATDIAAQVEGLSVQKASAALRYLVKAEKADVQEFRVKNAIRKAYVVK